MPPGPSRLSSVQLTPSSSSIATPIVDPPYAKLSIYEFLLKIQAEDPRYKVAQFASAFCKNDYLDLGEILHMDAKTIKVTTGMHEDTARYVRKAMDRYRQK